MQNEELHIQFEARKQRITKELADCGFQGSVEKQLWHGCKEDVVDKICTQGFNRSFAIARKLYIYQFVLLL